MPLTVASKPCRKMKQPTPDISGLRQANLSQEPVPSLELNLMLPLQLRYREEPGQAPSTSGFLSIFTEALLPWK